MRLPAVPFLPVSVAIIVLLTACGTPPADGGGTDSPGTREAKSSSASSVASSGIDPGAAAFVGSESCRDCHERFYRLWAPSHHGLAMQPFTAALGQSEIAPLQEALQIGGTSYQVELDENGGRVLGSEPVAAASGPGSGGVVTYKIEYALGGKNVYYFLTLLDRGRLQVLPVAYDRNAREWFDTTGSAVRHFPEVNDEALDWRHPAYTFNTSCFGCHVSQVSTNFDIATQTYDTTWIETGINCESCHGPAGEHVRICQEAPEGSVPDDLEIILTKQFDVQQTNDLCAACHAKGMPLSADLQPGSRFFDHFDLTAFDDRDFYPDGRDLGENYTQASWLMSRCVQSGQLDCLHCHTSSGRFRQKDDPDAACRPCHEERVASPEEHTRHVAGEAGGRCIDCHMPATWFARMERHDHSMRPPAPAATLAFESPNACNICHGKRSAEWADARVRQWHGEDSQEAYMKPARLVDAARKQDWSRLEEMLAHVTPATGDPMFTASLLRLLRSCPDDAKWSSLRAALDDASPLVRASAAQALEGNLEPETIAALLAATADEFRLVRVRAATVLAQVPEPPAETPAWRRATDEMLDSLRARPDDAYSHYNLGNYYLNQGDAPRAIRFFETSVQLRSDLVPPLVNLGLAYAGQGRSGDAERVLRQALEVEPRNALVLFNIGLLLGEQNRLREAAAAHRAALDSDPRLAAAAYNLGVIVGKERPDEAVHWCRRAAELRPEDPNYGYTLAYFLHATGRRDEAIAVLEELIGRHPGHADAWLFLEAVYLEQGRVDDARSLAAQAVENPRVLPDLRQHYASRLRR